MSIEGGESELENPLFFESTDALQGYIENEFQLPELQALNIFLVMGCTARIGLLADTLRRNDGNACLLGAPAQTTLLRFTEHTLAAGKGPQPDGSSPSPWHFIYGYLYEKVQEYTQTEYTINYPDKQLLPLPETSFQDILSEYIMAKKAICDGSGEITQRSLNIVRITNRDIAAAAEGMVEKVAQSSRKREISLPTIFSPPLFQAFCETCLGYMPDQAEQTDEPPVLPARRDIRRPTDILRIIEERKKLDPVSINTFLADFRPRHPPKA